MEYHLIISTYTITDITNKKIRNKILQQKNQIKIKIKMKIKIKIKILNKNKNKNKNSSKIKYQKSKITYLQGIKSMILSYRKSNL